VVAEAEPLPPFNVRNYQGGLANFLVGHIDGSPRTTVTLDYQDGFGGAQQARVNRRSRGAGQVASTAMPPVFVAFEAKRLEKDIAYIRFNYFADPVDTEFAAALAAIPNTRGLVVDLRGNPGGYFNTLDAIAAQLLAEEIPLYRLAFRDRTVARTVTPVDHPYRQPVAVLIDTTSTSCSELFAACLQAVGRAVVVGERSPGYLLGARWIRLPNGLPFMHTTLQPIPPDGRIIEGNGVQPDIEVAVDRQALLAGHDPQLAAAVAYLLRVNPGAGS
jgi:carboxyl-terminal processing protease